MSLKHGGNAFPVSGQGEAHRIGTEAIQGITDPVERDRIYIAVTAQAAQGMTLRDYFAAKAMPIAFDSQALLAAGEELGAKQGVALCAKMAWAIADAMLAAREVQS